MQSLHNIDLESDKISTKASLDDLVSACENMKRLEAQIAADEEALKTKKKSLEQLQTSDIPDMMFQIGLKDLSLADGTKVKIKDVFQASIPTKSQILSADEEFRPLLQKRQDEGFEWLRENDAESLIKNSLDIEFSKGQDNIVGEISAKCEELGLPYIREVKVHPQTLAKFLKEKVSEGVKVPNEVFGVFAGKKAVFDKKSQK